jgi:hypothetical protein
MDQDKIYYNTEYRKKIKALSKFNIFIKDRLTKKNEIQEARLKHKIEKLTPILYFNFPNSFKLIKIAYNKCFYGENYDLIIVLNHFFLRKNEKKINFFFKNQLILEYFLNGIISFYLLVNWLWTNEWNKWISFTDLLEYNFFNILTLFKYINNYFFNFFCYFKKGYNILLNDFFYNLNFSDNTINIYNIFSLNFLNIFSVLYNIEDIKLEHDKNIIPKEKWKNIRKAFFDYLKLDFLNDYYYLSFFSFSIYEFYIGLNNKYNIHYITLTFFDYWTFIIMEKNVDKYNINNKKNFFKFNFFNLKNIHIKIYKKKFFAIRVKLNLFLSNIDYFIFLKGLTFNFYIRNCDYFFYFISQRKLFLKYNNPTCLNRGSLTIWDYDKLYKKLLLLYRVDLNNNFNFLNVNKFEPFLNVYCKKNKNLKYIMDLFLKNYDVKFLYKIKSSEAFFYSINKFFNFNLINFYNLKSRLDSYKHVMSIDSVYEYRFANSSFKTMDEFMVTIFKTPLENYMFYNDFYKELSYDIVFKNLMDINRNFFFQDFNNNKLNYKFFFLLLKYCSKLFKTRIFFFKFNLLQHLMVNDKAENLLKIDVFSKFYNIFEKKNIFNLIFKLKQKHFHKRWSIKKFFHILKYNTMFYLDIYNMSILYSGWLYEILFFSRFIIFVKIYNKILEASNYYNNYKYLISFKDFYFQLIYENIEYSLIFIFIFMNQIKKNNNFNFLNNKNKINNNFIYRKYMLYTWLDNPYYNDLFDNLKFFSKENYSVKLSKWILRYFYKKSELHMFYTESLRNDYVNKKRLFL